MTDISFEHQTKAAWLDKVLKDLKGVNFKTIQCQIEPGLILDPFYAAGEMADFPPIYWPAQAASWKIVESFELNSELEGENLNREMIESLEGGSEVLEIRINKKANFNPKVLFANVLLELVTIRIVVDEMGKTLMQEFIQQYARERKLHVHELSVDFSGDKRTIQMASSQELSDNLAAVLTHLQEFYKSNLNLSWKDIIIDVPIGNEILINISKLRALKLLLYAFANEIGRPLNQFPMLSARIEANVIQQELESIIERGTKALGGVLGGVDEMHIAWDFPSDMKLSNRDKRRVSRNIHWLLKSECALGELEDPLNGSYWIEQCTRKLVERAWGKFKAGGDC